MTNSTSTNQQPNQQQVDPKNQTPPLAPLVLRIGVTGHRTEPDVMPTGQKRKRPIPDIPAIEASIHEVLEVIRTSFKGVPDTNGELFDLTQTGNSQPGGGTLRIISALASGADQWVAEEALNLGFEPQSVLPFERDEYLKDFTVQADAKSYLELLGRATAVLELDGKVGIDEAGKRKPDSRSYEAVGRGILNQTDLLIAVWDGKEPHGKGGTGQIVREALQNGIPVVWIPWSSPEKWQMKFSPIEENEIPADQLGDTLRLSETVRLLLLPPPEETAGSKTDKNLRFVYFSEKQKTGNPHLGIWMLFRSVICGEIFTKKDLKRIFKAFQVKDFESEEQRKADEFWTKKNEEEDREHPINPDLQTWITERYTKHYAWANGLSMFYGDMHRSAFLINYLFGALAVFLALVCIALGISGKDQAVWIVAELLVIVGILALTFQGKKRKWHQRWIDYRTLAEHLRLSRCLILLGGGSQQKAYEGHKSSYGNPANTWMYWHYRAIERAAGLPTLKFDADFLISCKEIWKDGLIQSQIDYHQTSFERFEKMDERLHQTGSFLFVATLIACILHLAHLWLENDPRFNWIPENAGMWMTLLCAFLPALGAAFAAIRNHGEVQRLAQRSKAMEETLAQLQKNMDEVEDAALNSVKLRKHAKRVNDLMTNEMLDWRVVFQDRPLGLPS